VIEDISLSKALTILQDKPVDKVYLIADRRLMAETLRARTTNGLWIGDRCLSLVQLQMRGMAMGLPVHKGASFEWLRYDLRDALTNYLAPSQEGAFLNLLYVSTADFPKNIGYVIVEDIYVFTVR
jgi:hypothetical protein